MYQTLPITLKMTKILIKEQKICLLKPKNGIEIKMHNGEKKTLNAEIYRGILLGCIQIRTKNSNTHKNKT